MEERRATSLAIHLAHYFKDGRKAISKDTQKAKMNKESSRYKDALLLTKETYMMNISPIYEILKTETLISSVLGSIHTDYRKFIQVLEESMQHRFSIESQANKSVCMSGTMTAVISRVSELEKKLLALRADNCCIQERLDFLKRCRRTGSLSDCELFVRPDYSSKCLPLTRYLGKKDIIDVQFLKQRYSELLQVSKNIEEQLVLNFIDKTRVSDSKNVLGKLEDAKYIEEQRLYSLKELYRYLKTSAQALRSETENKLKESLLPSLSVTAFEPVEDYDSGKPAIDPFSDCLELVLGDTIEPSSEGTPIAYHTKQLLDLMTSGLYANAAIFAATSPDGVLRDIATYKRFEQASASFPNCLPNGSKESSDYRRENPLFLYCEALVNTGDLFPKLSDGLSKEIISFALRTTGLSLVRFWLGKSCIVPSNALGDLLFEGCVCEEVCDCGLTALAQQIYLRLGAKLKIAHCLLKLGCRSSLVSVGKDFGFDANDYRQLFEKNPGWELYSYLAEFGGRRNVDFSCRKSPLLTIPAAVSVLLDQGAFASLLELLRNVVDNLSEESEGNSKLLHDIMRETSQDQMSDHRWSEVINLCSVAGVGYIAEEIFACLCTRKALNAASYHLVTDYFS